LNTLLAAARLSAVSALLLASCLEGQQPPEQPGQVAPAPPPAPATTNVQPAPTARGDADNPPPSLYGPFSAEFFYWLTYAQPFLRGGAAATTFQNLDYPRQHKYAPGVSISLPMSRTGMLNFSGFITKGATSSTVAQSPNLFGTAYTAGELLTTNDTIKDFKLSFQDLLFPFPRKDGQKWRLKTLWEVQYASIATSINAPFAPATDSSGNAVVNTASGSRWVLYPTFGLAGEYHLTKNLEIEATGSGFMVPHHATIGDAEGSIDYRLGPVELVFAEKFFHFKTSAQNSQYFKTTLTGPYVALRWYPSKFSIPCPFCKGRNTTTANSGNASPPASESTSSSPQNGATLSTGQSASVSPSTKDQQGNFVRRFSGGATLSVLGLSLIPGATSTVNNSASVSTAYTTVGASQRIGYGATAQVAVTDHFAIAVGGLLRRLGYQFTTTVTTTTNTVTNGVVNPTSTSTSTHEDTRARLIDIPAVVRYYGRGRHEPGPRWFVEGGGAYRTAGSIRTSISSTDVNNVLSCCTDTPARPAHGNSRGFVGGAGLQLIDTFGIRVVPEVRYTRWMNPIFQSLTTATARNEVAAGVSISF